MPFHISEFCPNTQSRGASSLIRISKKKTSLGGSSRAARVKRDFFAAFTKILKIPAGVLAISCLERRRVFFSFRREQRPILNGTTHGESFLNQLRRGSRTPKTSPPAAFAKSSRVCSSTTTRSSGAIRAATRLEFRHGNRLECARGNVKVV